MTVVVPWWTWVSFFPLLLDLLLDCRRIAISSQMVVDLATGNPPPDLQRLKLVACLISGASDTTQSVSLRRPKKLVEASWRGSTEKRYACAWRPWL